MTERAEKLRALAERVEAAPAGKPYDYMGTEAGAAMLSLEHDLMLTLYPLWEGPAGFGSRPLHHSLDACAALHEAVLGERWKVDEIIQLDDDTGRWSVKLGRGGFYAAYGVALTEPRARLAAILRALAEEEG
jgi:hypothetical protein